MVARPQDEFLSYCFDSLGDVTQTLVPVLLRAQARTGPKTHCGFSANDFQKPCADNVLISAPGEPNCRPAGYGSYSRSPSTPESDGAEMLSGPFGEKAMHEYEIRVLQASGSPTLITSESTSMTCPLCGRADGWHRVCRLKFGGAMSGFILKRRLPTPRLPPTGQRPSILAARE